MIIPTVAILIFNNDQVLLVRHGRESGHITGIFGLPSGRVETGEKEIETAIRELKEETGFIATEENLVEFPNNYYTALIPRKDGQVKEYGWRVYLCKKYFGELKSSNENEVAPLWVKINKLENSNLLPNVETVIKECLKYRNESSS